MTPSKRFPFGIVPIATTFVVSVCLLTAGLDGWRTYNARLSELRDGETTASNLARAVGQHAADTLKESDAVVLGLVDRIETDGTRPPAIDHVQALMVRFVSTLPQLQRLSIIDEDGKWITTSLPSQGDGIDVTDREYFRHHLNDPGRDAFVGPPIRAKSSGQWIVTLSRRFNHRDGSFGGVVLAAIDLDYFDHFYQSLDVGRTGTLVLASKRGQLLDRRPIREDLIGSSLADTDLFRNHVSRVSEGVVLQVSALDHVERQIAFKNLDEFPLYVVAALSTDETLAAWRADAILHSALIGLMVAALATSGFWLVRQIQRGSEVEAKLLTSQAELEILNRQLGAMAREDSLTRLVNRRELDRVLSEEISRAERTRAPLAFILLDVDFFKLYNDRYGHPAGDECLRKVGAVLAECVKRPGDLAARYGGEEFAVVLPGADASGAASVAEKIRGAVRALHLELDGSPKGIVTISAGVAVFVPNGSQTSLDALIRLADTALYSAKRNGRDMVCLHQPLLAA